MCVGLDKMKKFFVNVLCCFVPISRLRHKLRSKFLKPAWHNLDTIDWKTNHIWLIAPDGTRRQVTSVPNCKFKITGNNNNVYLHEPLNGLQLSIQITNNVNVTVCSCSCWGMKINICRFANGDKNISNIVVGKGCSTADVLNIEIAHGDGDVIIGEDCMFSWGCSIMTGDYHTIFDKNIGAIINHNDNVVIGNHVWVGREVLMLKGACIADNSVVGARSLVTNKFSESNIVVAGFPAKIIKRNVNWDRRSISEYQGAMK